MFSFFQRKPAGDRSHSATYDLDEPIPSAIAVTADVIERKLDISVGWTREARAALEAGDLRKHNGFLCLAKKSAQEAFALMEGADLLHEEILNQA